MAIPPSSDGPLGLALAVVGASAIPLLLLDGNLSIIAASESFWDRFDVDPSRSLGRHVSQLGRGEWNAPRLRSLLVATADGDAEISAYEMDFKGSRHGLRRLVLNARKLNYGAGRDVRILLAITDVTDVLAAAKVKEDLLREQALLLQELHHRVANSLQIVASVLLLSARKVQSEESRGHLQKAHGRVMSVAALQQHLAQTQVGDVDLRAYFTKLCLSLAASMIYDPNQLTIEVDADESSCPPDTSISLGLIVTELTINALKHAFPDERRGRIIVSYECNGPNWALRVHDDGVGMPSGSQPAVPGLGTGIVEALARQLHARVQVESANPGTRVSIVRTQIAAVRTDAVGLSPGQAA